MGRYEGHEFAFTSASRVKSPTPPTPGLARRMFFIDKQLLVILTLLNALIVTLNIPLACRRDVSR